MPASPMPASPRSGPPLPVWWFRNSLHFRRKVAEGISEPKPHQVHMLASVPLVPKFASEVTASVCELRNRDTRRDRLHATMSGRNVMAALTRRTMLGGLSAAAVLRPERAFAAWPERNISLIHGLTAGGGVDVSARVIAEGLSRKLGQQIVVEPKPGAAGTLAAAQTARATPDGYQ